MSQAMKMLTLAVVFLLLGVTTVQVVVAASTLGLDGAWQVPPEGRTLSVVINKKEYVTDAAVDAIRTAIMSTETRTVNGETQFVGWTGSFQNTNVNGKPIPLFFNVIVNQKKAATGDITINFKEGPPHCATLGKTEKVKSENIIVSAQITIYACTAQRFTSDGVQAVARALFGWGIGLGTSNDPNDLLSTVYDGTIKYVNQCHIKGLNTVYSDPSATSVSCP